MSNTWIASVAMLCPAEHRIAAAITAAALSGNPADSTPLFFSREIGVKGLPGVTFYLAHSRIREVVLNQLPQLLVVFPGSVYIITTHNSNPELNVDVSEWLDSLNLEYKDIPDDVEEE